MSVEWYRQKKPEVIPDKHFRLSCCPQPNPQGVVCNWYLTSEGQLPCRPSHTLNKQSWLLQNVGPSAASWRYVTHPTLNVITLTYRDLRHLLSMHVCKLSKNKREMYDIRNSHNSVDGDSRLLGYDVVYIDIWLFLARQPPVDHGFLIHEVSRLHTTTHHSRYDSSGKVITSSQRPLPHNTQHSQQTNIHAHVGIRIHNISRRAAVDRAATGTGILTYGYRYFGEAGCFQLQGQIMD